MLSLILVALAPAVLWSGAAVPGQKPDTTVEGVYSGDGVVIQGLGVCSITENGVVAWDMKGAPDARLSDRIRAYLFASRPQLNFQFGVRNRWMIVSRPDSASIGYSTSTRSGLNTLILDRQGVDGRIDLVPVAAEGAESRLSLTATLSDLPAPAAVDLKFKEGEEVAYDGYRVRVGPTQGSLLPKPSPEQRVYERPGKNWRVAMGFDSPPVDGSFGLYVMALDEHKEPIRYVDAAGVPVSPIRVLNDSGPSAGFSYGGRINPKYRQASVQFANTMPGATNLITNVDPKKISYLRMSTTRRKTITITGFPADPKSKGP